MWFQFINELISKYKKTNDQYRYFTNWENLETLLNDRMFEFFKESNLIAGKQPSFKPGDSCINQVLSITHEIINLLMIIFKSELYF